MSKAVLISIHPKWCGKIASREKTVEIRKNFPKIETPFKCYIYCTKDPKMQFWAGPRYAYADDHSHNAFDKCGNGKVIGEFICTEARPYAWMRYEFPFDDNGEYYIPESDLKSSCLTYRQLDDYGDGEPLFGWHISDLVIYTEPKELSELIPNCRYGQDGECAEFGKVDCPFQKRDYNPDGSINIVNCTKRVRRAPQSWRYVDVAEG